MLLNLQTINYTKIRNIDTVLPQSRVENDKDKQLHDMVQSILVVKFLVNSTPVLLGLNTKQEWNYKTITLSSCIYLL